MPENRLAAPPRPRRRSPSRARTWGDVALDRVADVEKLVRTAARTLQSPLEEPVALRRPLAGRGHEKIDAGCDAQALDRRLLRVARPLADHHHRETRPPRRAQRLARAGLQLERFAESGVVDIQQPVQLRTGISGEPAEQCLEALGTVFARCLRLREVAAPCRPQNLAVGLIEVVHPDPELPLDLAEDRLRGPAGRALEAVQRVVQIEADPEQVGRQLLRRRRHVLDARDRLARIRMTDRPLRSSRFSTPRSTSKPKRA